jgi:broad specificity phosphatase PhoE
LVRHGETEWSFTGQHTGRRDISLTATGRQQAEAVARYLNKRPFENVFVSPLKRARETCEIAGYASQAAVDPNLAEWNYGIFEGRTAREIQLETPGWEIWTTAVPEGESLEDVSRRAREVAERLAQLQGNVLLFAHGHFLRVLAAAWVGLPGSAGKLLALETAALSVLGYEHSNRVIRRWNVSMQES